MVFDCIVQLRGFVFFIHPTGRAMSVPVEYSYGT